MAIIKKKTRKNLSKTVQKLVRKHGPEIATGLVTTLVAGVAGATAASDDGKKKSARAGGGRKKAAGSGGGRKKAARKSKK